MSNVKPPIVRLHGREEYDEELRDFECSMTLEPVRGHDADVDYSAEVQRARPIRRLRALVTLPADRVWYLAPQRELAELAGSVTPPWPVGRFLVTEVAGLLTRWEFPRFGPLRFTKRQREVTVETVLIDRDQCGLTTCEHARWTSRREPIALEVYRSNLDSLADCAWIEPFPGGARAVICLTDHPDFDSAAKVELLAPTLTQHEIRITKAVFPKSDPPSLTGFEELGLDDSQYRVAIDHLFRHGSEIAFHGFTAKRNAPAVEECARRASLLQKYAPRTWIDHGHGEYLFSRRGQLADGVSLEAVLTPVGIQNYWSYFDLWDNPFSDASLYTRRRTRDLFVDLCAAGRLPPGATRRHRAWFVLHAIRTVIGIGNDLALRRRPWRRAGWLTAWRWHRKARLVRRDPIGIYGRDGSVFPQALGSTWVFDTVMLNHLTLQLAPERIDTLIHRSGILLGHSYMTCDHDYVLGNVFRRRDGRVRLDPAFECALANIQARQQAGEVLTMSFDSLRGYLERFVGARLRRTTCGWRVESQHRGETDGERNAFVESEFQAVPRATDGGGNGARAPRVFAPVHMARHAAALEQGASSR